MKPARRKFLRLAAGVGALPIVSGLAVAQAYPTRPVHLIVGFPPGGGADIAARITGQWLSDRLGQPFVIENRPGGGFNIAAAAVIDSRPDGYTLLLATGSNAVNATFYASLRVLHSSRRSGHIKANTVRALGATSASVWDGMPGILPIADAVSRYESRSWNGIGAPRGTPREIISPRYSTGRCTTLPPALRLLSTMLQ